LQSIAQIDDDYLRERTADVKDAAQRLLENLSGATAQHIEIPQDAVLVAEDLSPADLSMIEGDRFRGIVLATGELATVGTDSGKIFRDSYGGGGREFAGISTSGGFPRRRR